VRSFDSLAPSGKLLALLAESAAGESSGIIGLGLGLIAVSQGQNYDARPSAAPIVPPYGYAPAYGYRAPYGYAAPGLSVGLRF
jgi:hypothetical protein